jgi:hypothetical protein
MRGVLLNFYEINPIERTPTTSPLFVFNSLEDNRKDILRIIGNFVNPNIPTFDLFYKMTRLPRMAGVSRLREHRVDDDILVKTMFVNLDKRNE